MKLVPTGLQVISSVRPALSRGGWLKNDSPILFASHLSLLQFSFRVSYA